MDVIEEKAVQTQAVYGSSDVANLLKIKESTVRKYCGILEKAGYEFLKNEMGHRAFFDNDLIVLRKMLNLKNESDMSLEDAAKSVVTWKKGDDMSVSDTKESEYIARYNDLVREFKEFQKQQMEFNKELLQEIKSQREYIGKLIEEKDLLVIQSMRNLLESKQELPEPTKKKNWWKFWK